MAKTQEQLIKRVGELIALGNQILIPQPLNRTGTSHRSELRTGAISFLRSVYPQDHVLISTVLEAYEYNQDLRNDHSSEVVLGALRSAKAEIEHGLLTQVRVLIAGELFEDFLEMAEHLFSEGYKDAAAVIAGSSLEAHLRRMATAAGVPTEVTDSSGHKVPKKADTLNADVVKVSKYDKNEQKQVTAWLGIRNDAAHGEYARVRRESVELMVGGIRLFTKRFPA